MKRVHPAVVALAAWITVIALLASACRGAPAPTPTPAPPPTPPPAAPTPGVVATPTPTPKPTPTPIVKPAGELRIAVPSIGVEVMDPMLSAATMKHIYGLLYDSLVGITPEAKLSTETGLAQKWEASPDKKTWTFYLRKGVKFHSGSEVTSEDVKFSIERYMSPKSVMSFAGTLREFVDKMETPDAYTVVFHLKKPYAFLDALFSHLDGTEGFTTPKKYIQEKGEEYFNVNPIGSGPYRFMEQVIGSYVRFEAVENHWTGVVPKFQRLTIFIVPEEVTRIAMLKVGQADIIEVSRERVKELSAFNIITKLGSAFAGVWLDRTWDQATYLSDKRVREALNLAVNRDEILKNIFAGIGEVNPGATLYWGPITLGYEPLAPYPFDPSRAKELVSQAFPGGVTLDLYSWPMPGFSEYPLVAEAVAAYWSKAGVKAKIIPVDYGSYRTKKAKGDVANTTGVMGSTFRTFPGLVWRIIYHSKGLLTMAKDPQLDALIESIEAAPDIKEYGERAKLAARYMRDNHYQVGLVHSGEVYATNPQKVKEWRLGKATLDFNIPAGVR